MRKISSFTLACAFVLPLAACPGDDTSETSDTVAMTATESASASATESASASATESASASATESESASESASASATDGETESADTATESESETGGAGFCGATCAEAAECGDPAEDWECNGGFCEYIGEPAQCDPANCDDLMIGVCGEIDGVSQCTFPCTEGGGECDAFMLECSGMDDEGNMVCVSPPCLGAGEGELCEIEGFGAFGTCTDGVCTCESDEECTVDGLACNN